MSNTSNGRKISSFLVATTIPDTASISYLDTGTNFTISKANFLTALGVTGTIVSLGAVGTTPILSSAGTVNSIRNIEDGPGVKGSVSGTGGLKVEHDFTQDSTGSAITSGLTNQQPVFASLVGGAGITIAKVGDVITVSLT